MAGTEVLLAPLLERADGLLCLVIERNTASDCELPWGFLENRPALRLLVARYYLLRGAGRADEAHALACRIVTTLNPNDNHGLREEVTRLCLERGDPAGALAVCERYPDDALTGILFNRPLALFMLGRHADAESALRAAMASHPKVLPMLIDAGAKPPRLRGSFVVSGSREEAWLYREALRSLWESSGALTWARGVARK